MTVSGSVNASDVECPSCEADPGRNCRGMTFPDVHFTRTMRADNHRSCEQRRGDA